MTREEFYKKLLEAQIRGMLVGTYDTHNNLTEGERRVFFTEAISKGFFLKSDGTGASYSGLDEMLGDLINGKKILNLKTPHAESGYFALPANHNALYDVFSQRNEPNQTALNIRTSFGLQRDEIMTVCSNLAPGEAPPVPGGMLSSLWNRIVKLFTGHSSEAWMAYDRYQEERAMMDIITAKEDEYATANNNAKPGTVKDAFTERLIEVDKQGRKARGEILAEDVVPPKAPEKKAPVNEEQARINQVEEQLKAQKLQNQIEYNKKAEDINRLDVDVYNDFFTNNSQKYKTIDEALAAATKNYEAANIGNLNLQAEREIDKLHEQLIGNNKTFQETYWQRTKETSNLISGNAYQIQKFLKANSSNPDFLNKVDAEVKAFKDRCDAVQNPTIYSLHEGFNKSEIEIKLALRELNIEGADEFKPVAEMNLEKAEKSFKVFKEEPKPSAAAAEEKLLAGTATEEDLDVLLKQEDAIREGINRLEEKPKGIGNRAFYESIEFDFDLEQAGLKTDDPVKDKTLVLKMMRAQHEAINAQQEIPFFFGNDKEIEQSREEALKRGFITKEQFEERKNAPEEDELLDIDEEALEEERRQAEKKRELELEKEKNLKAKDQFLRAATSDEPNKSIVFNEFNRLGKLVEYYKSCGNEALEELANDAGAALGRAVDAKFGLYKYDSDTAAIDTANIITLIEGAQDTKFLDKFKANPEAVTKDILSEVKRVKISEVLLQDKPKVDLLFFRQNNIDGKMNRTTAGLFKDAVDFEHDKQQKRAEKNVQKTLGDYSKEQQALIGDSEKMTAIYSKLALQPNLPGQMAEEEVQLQNDATQAMGYLFSEILMKPQGADDDIDMNALVDNLTRLAMYQSLQNPEYREAYLTLLGTGKQKSTDPRLSNELKSKYRDMINTQISTSGLVPKIKSDRTALVELAFSDKSDLFTNMAKMNLAKGVSFTSLSDMAKKDIAKNEDMLNAELKKRSDAFGKEEAAKSLKTLFEMAKLERDVMEQVGKNFDAGTKLVKKQIEATAKTAQKGAVI